MCRIYIAASCGVKRARPEPVALCVRPINDTIDANEVMVCLAKAQQLRLRRGTHLFDTAAPWTGYTCRGEPGLGNAQVIVLLEE